MEYEIRNENRKFESYRDILKLSFKTNRQTGLIFHAGIGKEYMNLVLKEGMIFNKNILNIQLET